MAVSVKVRGARELRRKFNLLTGKGSTNKIRQILRKASRPAIKPILTETRSRVPRDEGILRRSFTIRALRRSRIRVGARVTTRPGLFPETFYGGFQEWGWTARGGEEIPGKRFMTKAAQSKTGTVVRIFSRIVDREITNAVRQA